MIAEAAAFEHVAHSVLGIAPFGRFRGRRVVTVMEAEEVAQALGALVTRRSENEIGGDAGVEAHGDAAGSTLVAGDWLSVTEFVAAAVRCRMAQPRATAGGGVLAAECATAGAGIAGFGSEMRRTSRRG